MSSSNIHPAYVLDIVRTPIGKYGRVLSIIRPDGLATMCVGVGHGAAVIYENYQ